LVLIGLALFRFQLAVRIQLWVFIPLVFLLSSYGIQQTIEARKNPDAYDIAGTLVAALISGQSDAQVSLFGPDEASLYKTSFYLDRTNSTIRVVSAGTRINPDLIPLGATNVLVFGGGQLDNERFEPVVDDGFKLYSLRSK
jgi:hypothetical protein